MAFLQSLGTSPVLQDLSKMMESGSAMTSASSLSTRGCYQTKERLAKLQQSSHHTRHFELNLPKLSTDLRYRITTQNFEETQHWMPPSVEVARLQEDAALCSAESAALPLIAYQARVPFLPCNSQSQFHQLHNSSDSGPFHSASCQLSLLFHITSHSLVSITDKQHY